MSIFAKFALTILLIQACYAVIFIYHTLLAIHDMQYGLEQQLSIEQVNKVEALITLFSKQLQHYKQNTAISLNRVGWVERSEIHQIHLIVYCTQSFLSLLWIGAKIANVIFEYGFRFALAILRAGLNIILQT
ncbi:hypothetical protein TI05_04745 [Achromatium sp. WMS3]|nr:hypothetical protein TI05_04745 [Achromatium sp. WMS3]